MRRDLTRPDCLDAFKKCGARRILVVLLAASAVGAISLIKLPTILIYNATPSSPRGWYIIQSARDLHVGDYVVAHLTGDAARLAAERGYVPKDVPVLKRVAAADGQSVCTDTQGLLVDGRLVAATRDRDPSGRPLSAWNGCRRLGPDELLLLSDQALSFDSRYFGPISMSALTGKAVPLWTW